MGSLNYGPVEKACPRVGAGSASGVPCLRRSGFAQAGRAFVGAFAVHKLGALRAVHPHVLRVRSGRQIFCGLVQGKARLGVQGLGG